MIMKLKPYLYFHRHLSSYLWLVGELVNVHLMTSQPTVVQEDFVAVINRTEEFDTQMMMAHVAGEKS